MVREFEGKTEQEAIASAMAELQLEQDELDIEIVDSGKRGLFKKSNVRIRVYLNDDTAQDSEVSEEIGDVEEFEQQVIDFLTILLEKMGYPGFVKINYRKEGKLALNVVSDHSSIIIGKKGKNLDAIQLIVNVYAGQLNPGVKVIIDSENYRMRHEEQLVKLAYRTAEQVKRNGRSRLLDPMNPFERRLIHTALNDLEGVTTKSEGEGLFKQVRISIDDELPPLRRE
ncbi:MAG TPA: protein jag [Sphaerochaeta sp.]|jgi:spoIIIJ-associated protein|nr:MAG: single-stranded DNA-binding protein [Spirochaetes bacterium GWC2_52_13]OHD62408.1 MAG: single-stranded DNA-binding protein [Spirochaetes bacterium GWF2_52_7]PKL22525.1 MAG: protein jag [Spirochaetae bacterium HGW-Spirochaetae-4]HCG64323.1 protein jag [Sphaerochaeta sp.]HCJ93780.1 protein jag [Sphaerochaeta sp.]